MKFYMQMTWFKRVKIKRNVVQQSPERAANQLRPVRNIGLAGFNQIVLKNISNKLGVMGALLLTPIVVRLLSIGRAFTNFLTFHKFCPFLQISVI